jgi:hypothetical protein
MFNGNKSTEDATTQLLAWCTDNAIRIDPRLAVVEDDQHGGLCIFNDSGLHITDRTTRESRPAR